MLKKLASLCHIIKGKILSKNSAKKCSAKTSFRPFCVCKELSTDSIRKWNF